jgi:hypothetical protein
MLRLVYEYAVVPAVSRTANTVSAVTRPVFTTAYTAATTVVSWVQPLPDPGHTTKWKHGPYKYFTQDQAPELYTLFKNPDHRNKLKDSHTLCALHNPGLGLDLMVIHDQKGMYDEWLVNHYADWTGSGRDRLFTNICKMITEDPAYYEPLIRETLDDRNSLLFKVLHDHRYSLSYPAMGGTKPSTLVQVNSLLRDLELNRIHAGMPSSTANKRK